MSGNENKTFVAKITELDTIVFTVNMAGWLFRKIINLFRVSTNTYLSYIIETYYYSKKKTYLI